MHQKIMPAAEVLSQNISSISKSRLLKSNWKFNSFTAISCCPRMLLSAGLPLLPQASASSSGWRLSPPLGLYSEAEGIFDDKIQRAATQRSADFPTLAYAFNSSIARCQDLSPRHVREASGRSSIGLRRSAKRTVAAV